MEGALGFIIVIAVIMMLESDAPKSKGDPLKFQKDWLDPGTSNRRRHK